MKEKFTTIDLIAVLRELNESLPGMRVVNVYDIDQKTYLIKLAKPDKKVMLLFESGCRIHTTEFEWPKSLQPSGFSMKLRKHLRSRRLISMTQLGVDRVVDLQFGSNQAAYHIIIELYDRGNVILTDYTYSILSLLRNRTDVDTDVRFAAREVFSMDVIKMEQPPPTPERVSEILSSAKVGDQLRHLLNPHFVYGSALLSHAILGAGLSDTVKVGGAGVDPLKDLPKVLSILEEADCLFRGFRERSGKGYLIQKRQVQPKLEGGTELGVAVGGAEEDVLTNVEFHPFLFRQHERSPHKEVENFDKAVDEFFSSRSSQKQDLKALSVKKTAVKKLDNIRKDHNKRIEQLQKSQEEGVYRAQLIEMNSDLVSKACLVIRSAVASSMDWGDIELLVKDAQTRGDPVAMAITSLKLKGNAITLLLQDHGDEWEGSSSSSDDVEGGGAVSIAQTKPKKKGTKVDIDLGLSAFANATRYYGTKKQAARKEQKTMDASQKALKSAEKKAKQTLKEASKVAQILKSRKVHWFEKFYWFISSENYLVIGGRDQQQNELIVKKYLKEGDVYVHADLHGATSVVIKNKQKAPIPPKTLNEAGFMAVCYSSAWDARIVTSAWWVYHNQVSKTAPTGEYLTTGSFMIRGKKNFLPPCQLVLGFGFLFRVEDSCIPNHLHERKVKDTPEGEDDRKWVESVEEEEISVESGEEGEEGEGGMAGAGEGGVAGEEEEEEEEDGEFPDTAIPIAHIGVVDTYEGVAGDSVKEPSAGDEVSIRHLSAKQRRDLRKHMPATAPPAKSSSGIARPRGSQQPVQQHAPPPQTKRGQKFKQKKAREKYADQDEEEKHLMMEFLASAGPQKEAKRDKTKGKKKKKAFDSTQSSNPKLKYREKDRRKGGVAQAEQAHKQKEPKIVTIAEDDDTILDTGVKAQVENGSGSGEEETKEGSGCGPEDVVGVSGEDVVGVSSEDVVGVSDESVVGVSGEDVVGVSGEGVAGEGVVGVSGEGVAGEDVVGVSGEDVVGVVVSGEDREAVESDEEEKKTLLAEENIRQLEEEEREQLTVLDALTGCPLGEDLLLYAIPVCGPYSAMLSYKYKVKLVPGNNRRGKAAKAAVHRFTQSRESLQREKDLLKSVKDNDLSRYIPGKVKMSLPQAHKQQHR